MGALIQKTVIYCSNPQYKYNLDIMEIISYWLKCIKNVLNCNLCIAFLNSLFDVSLLLVWSVVWLIQCISSLLCSPYLTAPLVHHLNGWIILRRLSFCGFEMCSFTPQKVSLVMKICSEAFYVVDSGLYLRCFMFRCSIGQEGMDVPPISLT